MNRSERLRLLGASVASAAALLALTVGVPVLLVGLHGRPDSTDAYRGLSGLLTGSVTPSGIVDTVAIVGWVAWMAVTIAILVEVNAWARGRPTPALRLAAPIQPWVRHLVATAALLAGAFTPTLRTASAAPIPLHVPAVAGAQPAASLVAEPTVAPPPTPDPPPVAAPAPSVTPTYTVVPRDTLWGIAQTQMRDPLRWREIFELNQGIVQADGRRLEDPNLILPGWNLRLPADTDEPTTMPIADATTAPTAPATHPVSPTAPTTAGRSATEPSFAHTPTTISTTHPATLQPSSASFDHRASPTNAVDEANVLGISATVAGGLLSFLTVARLARRRHRQPSAPVSPSARRVEAHLRDTADSSVLATVRRALDALAPSLAHTDALVLAMRHRRNGRVEVLLDTALADAPDGFEACDDPRSWITNGDTAALDGGGSGVASCIVTVGTTSDQPVMIDLATARLVTVDGDPALVAAWLHHAQVELATTTPDERVEVVLVGDPNLDPIIHGHPRLETRRIVEALVELEHRDQDAGTDHDAGMTVIVSTRSLDTDSRARVERLVNDPARCVLAIVPSPLPASWHAHLGSDGLWLTPPGLLLDPCRIGDDTALAITELLDPPNPPTFDVSSEERLEPAVTVHVAEWELEVRVLGPVDVMGAARPFDRHKHLEIAVYLALHPDGVSDERLKTALWPDRAPSTTTFNTAISTTRHRLGRDSDGDVFLSHYAAVGRRYQLSPRAGSDWTRFQAHVARAAHADREVTIDELRAALDLARGQPFAESYGFGWAWSEGHVATMEAAIADAAHHLASEYLEAGEPDQAIWAAMRGLLAAPADEVLYRDRMLAYDLAGNPAGITTVMLELEHVVESIEPWDNIHPETIALYRKLTRATATDPSPRHRSRRRTN